MTNIYFKRFDVIMISIKLISFLLIYVDATEFFIITTKGNYNFAINACLDDGAMLATITNENDYNIARELCMNTNEECWIGLNDLYSEGFWRYIDGTSVNGTYGFDINGNPTVGVGPWNNWEPNNGGNGDLNPEHCVHFWKDVGYKWNDAPCYNEHLYPLCMRMDTKPIKQYFGVSAIENYFGAINTCNDNGGVLASITNETENKEAISVCKVAANNWGCWFGLNYFTGIWNNVDGSDVRNSLGFDMNGDAVQGIYPWKHSEPNNFQKSEQCSHMWKHYNFRWNDQQWHREMSSLCMKNPPKSCGINVNHLKVWYKGGLNDISNNGYNAINITGDIYHDINDCGVSGNIASSFIIPYSINITSYTIVYIGAAFDEWILSTSYPHGYRINGSNMTNHPNSWVKVSDSMPFNLEINISNDVLSDWKIYEILIFDVILSEFQMTCIGNYLSQEHSISPINPTKTCPEILHNPLPIIQSIMATSEPTQTPSLHPSNEPSIIPSKAPSNIPTHIPSNTPTNSPTKFPTSQPTIATTETFSMIPNGTLTQITDPSNTEMLTYIILGSTLLVGCLTSMICCLILFALYHKNKHGINQIIVSFGTKSIEASQYSNNTISSPQTVLSFNEPQNISKQTNPNITDGNIAKPEEHTSNDIIHKRISSTEMLYIDNYQTTRQ